MTTPQILMLSLKTFCWPCSSRHRRSTPAAARLGDEAAPIWDQPARPIAIPARVPPPGGQAVVTQFAFASPGPPGQPDIITTRRTPSIPASRIVLLVTSRCASPPFPRMQRIAGTIQRADRQAVRRRPRQESPRARPLTPTELRRPDAARGTSCRSRTPASRYRAPRQCAAIRQTANARRPSVTRPIRMVFSPLAASWRRCAPTSSAASASNSARSPSSPFGSRPLAARGVDERVEFGAIGGGVTFQEKRQHRIGAEARRVGQLHRRRRRCRHATSPSRRAPRCAGRSRRSRGASWRSGTTCRDAVRSVTTAVSTSPAAPIAGSTRHDAAAEPRPAPRPAGSAPCRGRGSSCRETIRPRSRHRTVAAAPDRG